MQVSTEHLTLDERGNAKIIGTRIKVKHLAYLTRNGRSPEEIQRGIPHISLAQVHAALAYYYDHQTEIDAAILKDDELSEALANSPEQRAFVAKLRERAASMGFKNETFP